MRADLVDSMAEGAAFTAADHAPYRRHYLARQRTMEARIGPLRAHVRAALAGVSSPLNRLAALDAVLDDALRARERSLLSTVPLLLERRFDNLRKAHHATSAETPVADEPGPPLQPPAWLAVYCKDMQAVLLAELGLRLQPAEGLLDALHQETTGPP